LFGHQAFLARILNRWHLRFDKPASVNVLHYLMLKHPSHQQKNKRQYEIGNHFFSRLGSLKFQHIIT
jgi:hypothetical protein